MTNEELNYAVAVEVMGWKIVHNKNYCSSVGAYLYEDESGSTHFLRYDKPNVYSGEVEFDPSSNHAQAWQVVEKMRSMGWSYVTGDEADIYYCKFINLYITCSDEADTQQRAICEAALAAVRGYEMNCSKGIK